MSKYCPSDENLYDSDDETVQYGELGPLQTAAKSGDLTTVQSLVDAAGADAQALIDENTYRRYNALGLAAQKSHWDVVKYLVEKGATVDNFTTKRRHDGAVLYASLEQRKDIVDLLLSHKGDLNNNYDANHVAPLQASIANNHAAEYVAYLLEKGADVNKVGGGDLKQNALTAAIQKGNVGVIDLLNKAGATLPPGYDVTQGLYALTTTSPNLESSLQVALGMTVPGSDAALYPSEGVALALYGICRSRKPFATNANATKMLLDYSKKYQLDAMNTKLRLAASWIQVLVGFANAARVEAIFNNDLEKEMEFSPYELAVISRKNDIIEAFKPEASENILADAKKYE